MQIYIIPRKSRIIHLVLHKNYKDFLNTTESVGKKGLTEKFVYQQWQRVKFERKKAAVYSGRPQRSTKDNQRVYSDQAITLGPATVKVRFPKKERSKSTWKRFWKLFPAFDGFYTLNDWRMAVYIKSKEENLKKE